MYITFASSSTYQTTFTMTSTTQFMAVDSIKDLGFSPTSTGPRWGGKYKCDHCKVTGYITVTWMQSKYWWGHRHGNKCKKRFI